MHHVVSHNVPPEFGDHRGVDATTVPWNFEGLKIPYLADLGAKLPQTTQVSAVKEANVLNPVAQHG